VSVHWRNFRSGRARALGNPGRGGGRQDGRSESDGRSAAYAKQRYLQRIRTTISKRDILYYNLILDMFSKNGVINTAVVHQQGWLIDFSVLAFNLVFLSDWLLPHIRQLTLKLFLWYFFFQTNANEISPGGVCTSIWYVTSPYPGVTSAGVQPSVTRFWLMSRMTGSLVGNRGTVKRNGK